MTLQTNVCGFTVPQTVALVKTISLSHHWCYQKQPVLVKIEKHVSLFVKNWPIFPAVKGPKKKKIGPTRLQSQIQVTKRAQLFFIWSVSGKNNKNSYCLYQSFV